MSGQTRPSTRRSGVPSPVNVAVLHARKPSTASGAMLAQAFPVVTTAAQRRTDNTGTMLIALTVNEFRRLFDALLLRPLHTVADILAWSTRPATGVQWSRPPLVRRASMLVGGANEQRAGIQSAPGRSWMVHHSRGTAPSSSGEGSRSCRGDTNAPRSAGSAHSRCELVRGVGEFR